MFVHVRLSLGCAQAQWIWWMNFLCFVVHFSMVFVTFHMAYRRHGLWPSETNHMDVRIHRISMIPTPEMIRQNLTMWGSGWNGSLAVTEFYIKDNGLAVNYATLVMVFFGISAVFHFWALIFGAFERCWFWYWRQLVRLILVVTGHIGHVELRLHPACAGRRLRVLALARVFG